MVNILSQQFLYVLQSILMRLVDVKLLLGIIKKNKKNKPSLFLTASGLPKLLPSITKYCVPTMHTASKPAVTVESSQKIRQSDCKQK